MLLFDPKNKRIVFGIYEVPMKKITHYSLARDEEKLTLWMIDVPFRELSLNLSEIKQVSEQDELSFDRFEDLEKYMRESIMPNI